MQKDIILSMFEQKLFNLPCRPDINEHAAKEISQWSDLVEPLDWFPLLLVKIFDSIIESSWNCWVYSWSVAFSQKKIWEAKNLLKPEPERIEAFRNTVQCGNFHSTTSSTCSRLVRFCNSTFLQKLYCLGSPCSFYESCYKRLKICQSWNKIVEP